MVVVVTGTNGFIGSHLVAELLALGNDQPIEVRALVRTLPASTWPGVTPYVIDYNRPNTLVTSGALEGAAYVIHLAGITKALSLDVFREGNVAPVEALMQAIRTVGSPLRRFVLVSSQAAAGPARGPGRPMTEADSPAPFDTYGISKREAEQRLIEQAGKIPFTIVRPSAVYGPRDVDFLALFKQLRRGAGLYPANRDNRLATIFVDDLVMGLVQATFNDAACDEVFFLTNEEEIGWPEVYRAISDVLQAPLRFEWEIPSPVVRAVGRLGDAVSRLTGNVSVINSQKVALGLAPYWTCSAEKARRLIGFSPATPLASGLAQTLAWYRQQGWL